MAKKAKGTQDENKGAKLPDAEVAASGEPQGGDAPAKATASKGDKAEAAATKTDKAAAKADKAAPKGVRAKSRRTIILVAVVLCSIIMVGSILLPSLSAIVSGVQNTVESATETEDATTEEATTEDATTDEAETEEAEEETNEMIVTLDERYESAVEAMKTRLEEDSGDTAALINLANDYFTWASSCVSYASTDSELEHVEELFASAKDYYDQYLESNTASVVRANRAMCLYYTDDATGAVEELTQLVSDDPDCATAWSYLGDIYYANGYNDAATEAYNQVISVDPDDKYGLQSSATSQLEAISEAEEESEESTDDTSDDTADTEASE